MSFPLEIAIFTFLLAGFALIAIQFYRRAKTVERQLGLLMKAALSNTKDIRNCADGIETGFSDLKKSENHHRALVASLNSQMSNLNDMLHTSPRLRGEGGSGSSEYSEAAAVPVLVPPATPRPRTFTGKEAALPGYRAVANKPADSVVLTANEEAGRKRKVKTIEEFFRKMEQKPATAAGAKAANAAGVSATPQTAAQAEAAPHQPASASFADMVSQRRSVVNG